MKTLITSTVSLLLGLAIGWYVEHRHSEHEKTEIVQQLVEGIESSDGEKAGRAVLAIQAIDSGDKQRAVQLLSHPVARYYSFYSDVGANERRKKLIVMIEELARTNQVVAARIAEFSTNDGARTK